MLKKILIAVGVLILLPLITALFVKSEYSIRREIIIDKPREEVFSYVRYLRNQEHYSKWVMLDPNMKKSFRGTDGQAGFVYGWNGNDEAGEGEQEITSISEGRAVNIEVRFKRPFENTAYSPIYTESVGGNKTKVEWGMEGKSPYPLNVMNLFMGDVLGKDIEASLSNLKNILEKQNVSAQ